LNDTSDKNILNNTFYKEDSNEIIHKEILMWFSKDIKSNKWSECTRRNLHIFYFSLQLIFSHKWHLQLKWLVVALDKLHVTLVANDDVMTMSLLKQWMKYVFELTVFFICWLHSTCNYHASSDQFLMTNVMLPCCIFKEY